MLGEDVEKVAEKLDITPVMARKMLVLKERCDEEVPGIVALDPAKELDAHIMEVMGWWPGGLK